jgi:hypothetical protein
VTNAIEQYTDLKLEIIGLSIVSGTIDSIVNQEVLEFVGSNDSTEVRFPTAIHQKFFYIIVTDSFSRNTDTTLTQGRMSCIELLDKVCSQPILEVNQSATDLKVAHWVFKGWLEKKVRRGIWLPSLNQNC